MNKLKTKDKKVRSAFRKFELKIKILKGLAANSNLRPDIRWKSVDLLVAKGPKGSKESSVNLCIETFSKKSFDKKLKLSRFVFFRKARKGLAEGFNKAVW